jgi:acetyl-CoA C-acetyltransferase
MKEAVIVSTARTPIGKAYRGGFNNLAGATLGAAAVPRRCAAPVSTRRGRGRDHGRALQQGTTGSNVARQIALRAGCR